MAASRGTVRGSWLLGMLAVVCLTSLLVSCSALHAGGARRPGRGTACRDLAPDIYEKVSPAVVYIAATSINPYRLADRVSHTVGSGLIFDQGGLILTNAHVVSGQQSITVTLDDGTTVPAEVVGTDPIFDVAVLRIPKPSTGTLPVARLGDSERIRVGEDVIAIGNPLGLDQTLTRGVISAINRILPETPFSLLEPLIQTDAPINPGSSGGPLLNLCGEVIGINTAVMTDAQNIAFAIPINLVRTMLQPLISDGRIIRPWVGFHGTLVEPALGELLRMPLTEGLLVEVVEPGSPAQHKGVRGGRLEVSIGGKALLLGGDIVTRANDVALTSDEKLTGLMRTLKVGDTLRLTLFRNGEYREVEYVLPERPLLPSDLREPRGPGAEAQEPRPQRLLSPARR
jgi:S1-C subfamily serine protease